MAARHINAGSRGPIGASPVTESGGTPASTKKAWPATQSETAGATALNTIRDQPCFLRPEKMQLSAASATVAASGPKSSAELMKNVSAIEMLASVVAIRMKKDPV